MSAHESQAVLFVVSFEYPADKAQTAIFFLIFVSRCCHSCYSNEKTLTRTLFMQYGY